MIYVSKNGTEIKFKGDPLVVLKCISLVLIDPSGFGTESFLKIVWKHAGYRCVKVTFRETFKHPDGFLRHNYDLFFQTGPGLIRSHGDGCHGNCLNCLMVDIEKDIAENIKSVRVQGHHIAHD